MDLLVHASDLLMVDLVPRAVAVVRANAQVSLSWESPEK
jgi:hypothetical protein